MADVNSEDGQSLESRSASNPPIAPPIDALPNGWTATNGIDAEHGDEDAAPRISQTPEAVSDQPGDTGSGTEDRSDDAEAQVIGGVHGTRRLMLVTKALMLVRWPRLSTRDLDCR